MNFSRVITIVFGLLAALGLVVSAQFAVAQWGALSAAKATYSQAQDKIRLIRVLAEQAPGFVDYHQQRNHLSDQIEANRLEQGKWRHKTVEVKNIILPRSQVSGFLNGITNKPEQFFKPTSFVLKAIGHKDSLFQWNSNASKNVHLVLKGEYLIRRPL